MKVITVLAIIIISIFTCTIMSLITSMNKNIGYKKASPVIVRIDRLLDLVDRWVEVEEKRYLRGN